MERLEMLQSGCIGQGMTANEHSISCLSDRERKAW